MQESIYLKWVETKWPLVKNSDDLLAELANDYYSTYGQTACCPEVLATFHGDILREYSQHLENIKQKELMSTEPKKFVLKPGIVKFIVAENTYYTNDNLTDDVAERLLRTSPKAIEDFEVYPSDFDFNKPEPEGKPEATDETTPDQEETKNSGKGKGKK